MSPAATWCAKEHKLRWQLPQIGAGESGDLKVQFAAHVGEVALRSAGALAGVTGVFGSNHAREPNTYHKLNQ